MKFTEKNEAIKLRSQGHSIKDIAKKLGVAKSSVSIWVRDVPLTQEQMSKLKQKGHTTDAIERRRATRLMNEQRKRDKIVETAKISILPVSNEQLRLIGTTLYWAEGGKTQRLVRFSNGDPEMIRIMMHFFRQVCGVPEHKFRGYIHIHPHLDHAHAETYWSDVTGIPLGQFFKTYRIPNKSSQSKKNSLPLGVIDIYVLDTALFYTITGWAKGIFLGHQISEISA